MLSTLIWLPIIGAVLFGLLPQATPAKVSRTYALVISSTILAWTGFLVTRFDLGNPGFQMQEFLPWIPSLGLNYQLGVDGISLPLIALSGLLTWIVVFGGKESVERPKLYYSMILLINAGMAGALLAQNLLMFVLFYELELIPLYLLIAIWGGKKSEGAAMKFLIYTAISGILILVGFLALGWLVGNTTGVTDFDYTSVKASALPIALQLSLLVTLIIGFAIKIPLVPFHTWLPDTYVESSPAIAILLGGVLAKLGTYGLLRFCLGLFPQAWAILAPWLAIWAAVTVLYGALVAIAQKDIKRMVAFSSIGHMGYVLLACAAVTPLSLVGAVAQMVSHGLVLAILFYLVGTIEDKVGTRDLDVLNGLLNPIRGLPMTSALLILAGMASAGIPGLVGFVSEFLVFQGSYSAYPLATLLCIVGTGLTAVYFVILLNRTCFGKLDSKTAYYPKVTWREQVPALVLTALICFLGVQPVWLVRWSEASTANMVAAIPTKSEALAQMQREQQLEISSRANPTQL